jgi:hypothetical protein
MLYVFSSLINISTSKYLDPKTIFLNIPENCVSKTYEHMFHKYLIKVILACIRPLDRFYRCCLQHMFHKFLIKGTCIFPGKLIYIRHVIRSFSVKRNSTYSVAICRKPMIYEKLNQLFQNAYMYKTWKTLIPTYYYELLDKSNDPKLKTECCKTLIRTSKKCQRTCKLPCKCQRNKGYS